jgi:hypothetical protein
MTPIQERAITLAINVLNVGFFECPKHFFQYFIDNDEWALLMAAGEINAVGTPPPQLALEVLRRAVAREGFFATMTDFKPPRHHCSFLLNQIQRGERGLALKACEEGQQECPHATFDQIKGSGSCGKGRCT